MEQNECVQQEKPAEASTSRETRHVFTGRIHPDRYGWHVDPGFDGHFETEAGPISLKLRIVRSQVAIDVRGSADRSLIDLKNLVEDLARAAVDAMGFAAAAGLDLEIISCVNPHGELIVFNTGFDGLRDHGGDFDDAEHALFRTLAVEAGRSFGVRSGLADLRLAIRSPSDTLFYCYRAIESVRQDFLDPAHDGVDEKAARRASWAAMRTALGVDEDELRWLEARAVGRRHGELGDVPEADRRRALLLARAIVAAHATRIASSGSPAEATPGIE